MTHSTIERAVYTLCKTMSDHYPEGSARVTVYPDGQTPRDTTLIELKLLPGLLTPLCIQLEKCWRAPNIFLDGQDGDVPSAAIYWHPRKAEEPTPLVLVTPHYEDEEAEAVHQAALLERARDIIPKHQPEQTDSLSALTPAYAG